MEIYRPGLINRRLLTKMGDSVFIRIFRWCLTFFANSSALSEGICLPVVCSIRALDDGGDEIMMFTVPCKSFHNVLSTANSDLYVRT